MGCYKNIVDPHTKKGRENDQIIHSREGRSVLPLVILL